MRNLRPMVSLLQEEEHLSMRNVNRRRFLRSVLGTGGTFLITACSPSSPPNVADSVRSAAEERCPPPQRPWLEPDYQMEKGPIVRASFGGSFAEQEYEAVWKPFQELTGIEVVEVPHNSGIYEQVRAQRAVGRVEFDIVEGTPTHYIRNTEIWMPIDYSIFPRVTLDAMEERWKQPKAIGYGEVPLVIAWSEEAFPGPDKPDSWKKFWDVKKYPGGRALGGILAFKNIEAALLADGVPKDQLYPLDFDRAFRKLEEIKPHIVKWHTSGTESQQLLASGDVTVSGMSNSRIENLMDQNLPFTYTLNEAIVHCDFIGVVKGAPNARAAMAALAFRFEPAIGAAIGELWRQPIPSSAVLECADPVKRKRWTSHPAHADKIVLTDPFFWAGEVPNGGGRLIQDEINERFTEFISI